MRKQCEHLYSHEESMLTTLMVIQGSNLDRNLVEHILPTTPNMQLMKQVPENDSPTGESYTHNEFKKIFQSSFIKTVRYV